MIVELVGLPGAGKTTLKGVMARQSHCRLLAQQLVPFLDYIPAGLLCWLQRVVLKRNGHLNFLGALIANYLTYRLINKTTVSGSSLSRLISALLEDGHGISFNKLMITLSSFALFEKASKAGLRFVFDEGPAQRGVTYSRTGVGHEELENYFKAAPKPDVLIVLDIAEAVASQRVILRDGDSSHLLLFQEEMFRAVKTCEYVYKKSGVFVVRTEGYKDIEGIIQKLPSVF